MNTYESVLRRGLAVWDRERMPRAALEERLERIRTAMQARGLRALLIHGDAWKGGDLAYAAHYVPMTREAVALVPLEGDPALYVSLGSRDIPAHKELTWIEEVHVLPALSRDLAGRLRKRGAEGSTVGLVGVLEEMRASLYDEVRTQCAGSKLVPCTDWYRELRLRKDPGEVALLREAAAVAETCRREALSRLQPGVREFEIAAEADYTARRLGAEDCRILLTSGPETERFLRPPRERRIAPGDNILFYLALCRQRYWTELGCTLTLGEPEGKQAGILAETRGVYDRILRSAGPGDEGQATLSEAAREYRAHLEKHRAQGSVVLQGIGLDREEAPRLDPTRPASPLLPGMCVSVRLRQHAAGGGAFFSEPLLVSPRGCEPLAPGDTGGAANR